MRFLFAGGLTHTRSFRRLSTQSSSPSRSHCAKSITSFIACSKVSLAPFSSGHYTFCRQQLLKKLKEQNLTYTQRTNDRRLNESHGLHHNDLLVNISLASRQISNGISPRNSWFRAHNGTIQEVSCIHVSQEHLNAVISQREVV